MIIDASTVIVLRDAVPSFEVFMVRRHGKSSFMANAWVYPGGRLDESDARPDVTQRIVGTTPAAAREHLGIESETRAAGLYLAGIRETFEEAGVFLAKRRGSDDWIDLVHEDHAPIFADYRKRLQGYDISLSELAEAEDLVFPLGELGFFAHWITPTFEPKRFDTFFFLARAPENQEPLHDERETTASGWIAPSVALEAFRRGEAYLAPPTIRTLERLSDFDSIDRAFAHARETMPPTIIPHLHTTEDTPLLLLPGDPEYPSDDPDYALATPVTDGPTRMRLSLP